MRLRRYPVQDYLPILQIDPVFRPLAILAIVLIPSLNERQALSFARRLQSVKEISLMNFTVIKQMRHREDQICMSNHYLVEEWPFGDS